MTDSARDRTNISRDFAYLITNHCGYSSLASRGAPAKVTKPQTSIFTIKLPKQSQHYKKSTSLDARWKVYLARSQVICTDLKMGYNVGGGSRPAYVAQSSLANFSPQSLISNIKMDAKSAHESMINNHHAPFICCGVSSKPSATEILSLDKLSTIKSIGSLPISICTAQWGLDISKGFFPSPAWADLKWVVGGKSA